MIMRIQRAIGRYALPTSRYWLVEQREITAGHAGMAANERADTAAKEVARIQVEFFYRFITRTGIQR